MRIVYPGDGRWYNNDAHSATWVCQEEDGLRAEACSLGYIPKIVPPAIRSLAILTLRAGVTLRGKTYRTRHF